MKRRGFVGQVAAALSGAANFLLRVTGGVVLTTVGTFRMSQAVSGFIADAGRQILRAREAAGIVLTHLVSGTVRPLQVAGIALTSRLDAGGAGTRNVPGMKIRRIQFDLTHRRGANAQAGTGDAWTNPGNAIDGTDGKHNGTVATRAGQVLSATDGTLTLDYPNFANKSTMTITSVKLHFYVQQAGTVLNNGGLILRDGATVLETITGDVNSLTTPRTFDVTAAHTTWASLDSLQSVVRANLGIGTNLVTCSVDAVELEVVATETQTP